MFANYYKISIPKESLNDAIVQICKVQNYLMNNADGCIKFHFTHDLEDDRILYLFTIWDTKENYEKNLVSEYDQIEIFDKLIEYKAAIVSAEQFIISNHSIVA
jgi:quinol monooxygenase YgiN